MTEEKFTPTEDLLLEVLIARARLGETLWTFESRQRKALESLQERGWVMVMHGIVEKTVRASLTEKAKDEFMSSEYKSPLQRKLESLLRSLS